MLRRLQVNEVKKIENIQLFALVGLELNSKFAHLNASAQHLYLLPKTKRDYSAEIRDEAQNVVQNYNALVYGINTPKVIRFINTKHLAIALDPNIFNFNLKKSPRWSAKSESSYIRNAQVFLGHSIHLQWKKTGSKKTLLIQHNFRSTAATKEIRLEANVSAEAVDGDFVLVSPALLAYLRRGERLPLTFDPVRKTISEQSVGFRGFRIVAKGIDQVPALAERFESKGMKVRTKSDSIRMLQKLESSLNILVTVIAFVALLGGYAILSSFFFANVQRKRVDYATIRLLGMPKRDVFAIPMIQATLIAIFGFLGSVLLFAAVSSLLNGIIAHQLQFDGKLSLLYPSHFVMVAVFILIVSVIASIAASREATRIDPAQALRAR